MLFPVIAGSGFIIMTYIRNESARTLYIKLDPTKAHHALKINSSDQIETADLEARNQILDRIWGEYFEKINPLLQYMHLLSEHDLVSWLNFYRLFRKNETENWMRDLETKVENAENGIEKICNEMSENCTIRYGCVILLQFEFFKSIL